MHTTASNQDVVNHHSIKKFFFAYLLLRGGGGGVGVGINSLGELTEKIRQKELRRIFFRFKPLLVISKYSVTFSNINLEFLGKRYLK